jgi:hypothetical protein
MLIDENVMRHDRWKAASALILSVLGLRNTELLMLCRNTELLMLCRNTELLMLCRNTELLMLRPNSLKLHSK